MAEPDPQPAAGVGVDSRVERRSEGVRVIGGEPVGAGAEQGEEEIEVEEQEGEQEERGGVPAMYGR